jgi:hypothetical protein
MFEIDTRYLNGKIYKLVSNVNGEVYFGSTIQSLKRRLSEHKSSYKTYLKGKTNYVTSFKIIETGDYDIHLVETYVCLCRSQLESIERVYIEGYACINKCVVGRTHKESMKAYCEKNREKQKVYSIEYYAKNKDKKKVYHKAYRENNRNRINQKFNCQCGGKYTSSNKLQHFKTQKHNNNMIDQVLVDHYTK